LQKEFVIVSLFFIIIAFIVGVASDSFGFMINIYGEIVGIAGAALLTYYIVERLLQERRTTRFKPQMAIALGLRIISTIEVLTKAIIVPEHIGEDGIWLSIQKGILDKGKFLHASDEFEKLIDIYASLLPEEIVRRLIYLSSGSRLIANFIEEMSYDYGDRNKLSKALADTLSALVLHHKELIKELRSNGMLDEDAMKRYDKLIKELMALRI